MYTNFVGGAEKRKEEADDDKKLIKWFVESNEREPGLVGECFEGFNGNYDTCLSQIFRLYVAF